MIPLRNKRTNIRSEVAKGKKLQEKIKQLAEEAAGKSIDNDQDLDVSIAEISKREKFNRMQIQRLVEEGNTVLYNKRYDKVKSSNDRRITFNVASLDGVVDEMGSDAPPEMDNPNFSTGAPGKGEMAKAASAIEPTPIHNPNAKLEDRKEKYDKRMKAAEDRRQEKLAAQADREHSSNIFKIANSLVMSEKKYRNANEVFNTMLDEVSLPDDAIDGIVKKASEISETLVKTKRSYPGFVVTLEQNSTEKVASHVLGEYSLIKEAEDNTKVKQPKVQPTVNVTDFEQLVDLARKLEKQQQGSIKKPAPAANEVK